MAGISNSVAISSPGVLSMAPGVPVSFAVWWGQNISPLRFSRISAALVGDEGAGQSVTMVSEGWAWSPMGQTRTDIHATLRVQSLTPAPLQVRLQVITSQQDTF